MFPVVFHCLHIHAVSQESPFAFWGDIFRKADFWEFDVVLQEESAVLCRCILANLPHGIECLDEFSGGAAVAGELETLGRVFAVSLCGIQIGEDIAITETVDGLFGVANEEDELVRSGIVSE